MSDFLTNKALSTYFLLDTLLPDEVERKSLMKKLTQIFCIKRQSFKLYAECDKEAIKEIKNAVAYNRYRRLKEYNELQGYTENSVEDAVTEELITIKGKALTELQRFKITTAKETNGTDALLELSQKANKGILLAMYAYGIILCEGLGVEPNIEEGVKYLKKVADWNNIEACIICIYYCRDLKNEYGDKLYTYLIGTPYAKDMDIISVQYALSPKKDDIAALTCKLFAHHVAVSEQYDWQLARILKCEALSEPDKQDIVLSGGRETIKRVSALPLNLKGWEGYTVNSHAVSVGVENEYRAVELALKNIDTLTTEKYRPLCICGDDRYMLNAYLTAISQTFGDCNVFTINVEELGLEHLGKLFDNEVMRGIKESSRNVVVISVCGDEVAYPVYDQLISHTVYNVLNTEKRRAFKADLNVSLNLVNLLPIVVCDRKNLNKFRTTCHVVRLSDMTEEDRKKAIADTVEANKKIYELKSVRIDEDASAALIKMKCNKAIDVLDKLFASYDDGGDVVITLSDVNKFTEDTESSRTGF